MTSTVARLMRAYHEAAATFAIPDGAVWQWPAHQPQEATTTSRRTT
jgi:hypothetical protein